MKKVFVLGMSVMLFWSCNNTTEKATKKQKTETHAEHQHDESSEAIELNKGEKWMVNEEMKPFVLKGEELVNSYIQNNQTDYKALDQQLKEKNDQLIKSCTMDGKSHDELMIWIDDQELSWQEFGRMLNSYMGWGMRIMLLHQEQLNDPPRVEIITEPSRT